MAAGGQQREANYPRVLNAEPKGTWDGQTAAKREAFIVDPLRVYSVDVLFRSGVKMQWCPWGCKSAVRFQEWPQCTGLFCDGNCWHRPTIRGIELLQLSKYVQQCCYCRCLFYSVVRHLAFCSALCQARYYDRRGGGCGNSGSSTSTSKNKGNTL